MADLRRHGATSNRFRLVLKNATTGVGLTGLTEASAGLIIATIADNEAATTRYRASSGEIETITTLGTFAAPTATKCRFKEVDAVNHPGLYEVQLDDARVSVAGAQRLVVSISGAVDLLATDYEIQLTVLDVYVAPATATALADVQTDVDTVVTQTTGLATSAALATAQADLDTLTAAVAAVQADVDTAVTQTTGLATSAALTAAQADIDALTAALAAVQVDVDTAVTQTTGLATTVDLAAAQADLDALTAALAAVQADIDTAVTQTTGLATSIALAAVQAAVDATAAALAAVQVDVDTAVTQTIGVATSAALAAARVEIDAIRLETDLIPTANEIADAHLDRVDGIEAGLTPRGALRLTAAVSAGKLSGAPTATLAIRNVGDTKNRITATVDADGNRTAVVTDVT